MDGGREEEPFDAASSLLLKLLLPLRLRRWKLRAREEAELGSTVNAGEGAPRDSGDGPEDATFRLARNAVSGGGMSLSRSFLMPLLEERGVPPPSAPDTDAPPSSPPSHSPAPAPDIALGVLVRSSPPCPHLQTCRPATFASPPPPSVASSLPPALILRSAGLLTAGPTPCPTSGDRNRLSYDVFRLKWRDGVLAPRGGGSDPGKNDDPDPRPSPLALPRSPPNERGLMGVPCTLAGRLVTDDADADQAATAATAVAAAPDGGPGVPIRPPDVDRRGESKAVRLSQDTRRALQREETRKHTGNVIGSAWQEKLDCVESKILLHFSRQRRVGFCLKSYY